MSPAAPTLEGVVWDSRLMKTIQAHRHSIIFPTASGLSEIYQRHCTDIHWILGYTRIGAFHKRGYHGG